MLNTLLTKIIGTKNDRELKKIQPLVARIAELEADIRPLSDDALRGKTIEFRERLARGETLDDLLPEAYAVVREAGWRVLRMRHFDVQMIGGIALHRGMIAEMKTGEGKTLVATLPAYLNALSGQGVHIVTVNDYLARRDSEWMGRIFRFLGLSVGVIQHSLSDQERQKAYNSDITYATNNELGFDYLRDNMKFDLGSYVQRGHHFAVVDEVDSILIDEARTPLIISGPAEESTDKYYRINGIIPKLIPGARISGDKKAEERAELEKTGDYIIDEKAKTVTLTEAGMAHVERLLGVQNLWDPSNMETLHHVNQGLRAHTLFENDVDYVVKDGQVIIVDEFTGRLMPGRRWSDGLHQAIEAKEKVKIERENQTLATVTFQNYFRMYGKLCGMTGTAETEAAEFDKIYKLEVLVIPTNRPMIRIENPDVVYRTEPEKFGAVVDEIKNLNGGGRPVLVGTISIEKSEQLSTLLKREGIKHVVLNAKYHEREAEIVAQAGRFGAVTIATNMAGRGTDIILGGITDHRVKAILSEQAKDRPADAPPLGPEAEEAARQQALTEMARDFKKGLDDRKLTPEAKRELSLRYLGLAAAFSTDHPTIAALQEIAAPGTALRAYLDAAQALTRKNKEAIARAFYPQIEDPIDFLGTHPMKAQLHALADAPEFAQVVALLDGIERERVVALGGLHILATERHEARRIDNQLRGRAGRQGDPGSSRFYLSLQDDLMRIFGSDRISGLMLKLGMEEGVPIEHGMVTRSIERAQKQVEAQNFAVRKHLIEYDDVMNKQRKAVYDLRRMVLEGKDTRAHVTNLIDEVGDWYLDNYCEGEPDKWNMEGLQLALKETFGLELGTGELHKLGRGELKERISADVAAALVAKEQRIGPELMLFHMRMLMLQIVDAQWKDHLYSLDHLKEGIGLRAHGQRDPLVEYKKESYTMFQALMDRIDEETLKWIFLYEPVAAPAPEPPAAIRARAEAEAEAQAQSAERSVEPALAAAAASASRVPHAAAPLPLPGARAIARNLSFNDPSEAPSAFARAERTEAKGGMDGSVEQVKRDQPKVGRNDPCPCGSGKKYKKCHGQ
ncbi:MAG: preprotein translocase subunit SecA [Vicinamibacteria bacterium]|nr:preprotein translocase subunit SecA [Vicinamibacteria bacterium]